jgi:predicted RecA/RadA family phage recombinase
MAQALYRQPGDVVDYTAVAAISAGDVVQLSDGTAGVATTDIAAGELGSVAVDGIWRVEKTTSMVILDGGRLFWDHSANKAHFKSVNDRDFYLGTAVGDAASSATTVDVHLNRQQRNTIDALNGPSLSVATGTSAAGGFGLPQPYGGSLGMKITSTSEVQCVDILSVDRVAIASNPILEAQFRIGVNGSGSASDFSIGFASASSTSDADAIAEHVLFHTDGNALDLFAQSKDGVTTVTATDTTVNVTAGSAVANRFEVWIDARDPADIQLYVDGVNVLPDTVFSLAAGTGPIGALAHYEKSTGTETGGPIYIDRLTIRTMEQ